MSKNQTSFCLISKQIKKDNPNIKICIGESELEQKDSAKY